jgi:hypothetical protein
VLVVLMLALAGTLLAASTASADQSVSVIEPIPPLSASDGGK